MDSETIVRPVGVDDVEEEINEDNMQTKLDAGRGEEINDNEPKSLIMELYPWIQQFKKMCRTSLFQPSMTSLKHLMMYYTRNVRLSVNDCYTKPLRAEKVKDSIGETLLFFLYYYRVIGEDHDRASYMDLLTDLLAMYIDMELKASKKGREDCGRITARLTSCLHLYLDNSAEHLLDTLLKVHFMTHNYHEILDPVITKILKGIQDHPSSSITYVRYFLVYRLWKKLNKNVAARNQINVFALASLGTAPNDLPSFFIEYVQPKVPNSQKITTKLLLSNKFDVDKCREEFFKFCKTERGFNASKPDRNTFPANTQPSSVPEDNDDRVSIVDNNVVKVSNEPQQNSSSSNLIIHDTDAKTKKLSFSKSSFTLKSLSRRKPKKSNDIVMIDLTSDNVTEKVIRHVKNRRKPLWLEKAKKNVTAKLSMNKKIDSTTEDAAVEEVQQLEDTPNLDSLRIESPRSREILDTEIIVSERAFDENPTSSEETTSRIVTEVVAASTTAEQTYSSIPKIIEFNDSGQNCNSAEDDETATAPESMKNSVAAKTTDETRTELPKVTADISETPTIESRTAASADPTGNVESSMAKVTLDDTTELPNRNTSVVRDDESRTSAPIKFENDKPLETRIEPIQLSIKAEHVSDENYEITNDETIARDATSPVNAFSSSFEINCNENIERIADCSTKIRDNEFQENIDGLSLLASVSQRVSHLTTTPPLTRIQPVNGELIKVKNYASLANLNVVDESVTSEDTSETSFCAGNETDIVNRIVGIYPEEAMDKVAYEVEVTSAGEIDSCENGCDDPANVVVAFQTNVDESCRVNQPQNTNVVGAVETVGIVEKDDNKVILNGETVVLFQKSPNSNVYIINKAVENRDHVNDDVTNGIRDIVEHVNENGGFTYEFPYENVYRNQSSIAYDLTQYNRDASAQDVRRSKKIIVGADATLETNKTVDAMELSKSGKSVAMPLDVIGKGSKGKRKSSSNSGLNRRRRIKQEFNGCGNDLAGHITPNYGIKERSQERVESNLTSIHIPVTHSSSLSSIYTTYAGSAELYLPCHKNFNSMSCGMPVAPNGSTGGKTHCSCLNCTYGIVAHCGECILPNAENRTNSIENNSYYLPIHSTVQTSAVQDCGGPEKLVKIFDDKLVCKLEPTIMNGKPLDNVGVKSEPKEIYRAELDNKLPLKKRFRAMMSVSFEEMSIKREKTQSYPGTPMLSIAALDSREPLRAGCTDDSDVRKNNTLDLSSQGPNETNGSSSHHGSEMIRRDYRKDAMMMMPLSSASNGYRSGCGGGSDNNGDVVGVNGNGERKRKRKKNCDDSLSCNVDETRNESTSQKINKTTTKHKETSGTFGAASKRVTVINKSQARPLEKVKNTDAVPTKNSTRQTRSSKRNLPKVNYMYTDGDSDWNPSAVEFKRKRKKTSR